MTLAMEKEVEVSFDFEYEKLAKEVIAYSLDFERFPYEAEVCLTLTDDASIREVNRSFRGVDRPTDVLSFPMLTLSAPGDFSGMESAPGNNFNPETGEALLGDIVLSVPRIFEQAKRYGHSARREYAFLIVHSVLHLLGYDHMTESDAALMENKQEQILKSMGILRTQEGE